MTKAWDAYNLRRAGGCTGALMKHACNRVRVPTAAAFQQLLETRGPTALIHQAGPAILLRYLGIAG